MVVFLWNILTKASSNIIQDSGISSTCSHIMVAPERLPAMNLSCISFPDGNYRCRARVHIHQEFLHPRFSKGFKIQKAQTPELATVFASVVFASRYQQKYMKLIWGSFMCKEFEQKEVFLSGCFLHMVEAVLSCYCSTIKCHPQNPP